MKSNLFPGKPDVFPKIYAYEDTHPQYKGLLKVGYTTIEVKKRVREQYPILRPGPPPYKIVLEESAMRNDGTGFIDTDVHRVLRKKGFKNPEGEWFRCKKEDVRTAILQLKSGKYEEDNRYLDFKMRPEQEEAVLKTSTYFKRFRKEYPDKVPHFLWNAKMRFGKTFAVYQLAKRMKWEKILVLTFKPAVENAWEKDLIDHVDFKGWQFISKRSIGKESVDKNRPYVCFGSFQDYLGKNKDGGIKSKNEWVHAINWDCIVLDEYHWGAWRDRAKELFEGEDKKEEKFALGNGIEYYDEEIMPITTDAYLYLSGTPFRAITNGEFIEEQIFNWTYSDEQKAKHDWKNGNNPYLALPQMVLLTYKLPDLIRDIARKGEFNEFSLNEFFKAEGAGKNAKFKYISEVQKWLDFIRGALSETTNDNLKLGAKRPPMPFSDYRILNVLNHTFWFLPNVASCYAMRNLLREKHNTFYHEYKVIVAAGTQAGIGLDVLNPVLDAMDDPLMTKTITLSCGKLTTGVTVRPWTGIFMLRDTSSPETYFQAAFRVQNPWTVTNPDNVSPNKEEIIKKECYVFDFAPDRALRQIVDYSCSLNTEEINPERKVEEFISFLPVLAYDGSQMERIDPAGILDMAMSGTTATLLARRWESALLVNVDNITLQRLMDNKEAMKALMNIEGFRSLNKDIETIINKSGAIKRLKKESSNRKLKDKERKELTEAEKQYKSMRKQIQDKLIKFATRIPVFMYLTDYREMTLKDVITQLEPALFKKVTGLTVKDFELLVSLGVFNSSIMNDAVYKFKRYEDASLVYTGINKHEGEKVGLYDTVLKPEEYNQVFENKE